MYARTNRPLAGAAIVLASALALAACGSSSNSSDSSTAANTGGAYGSASTKAATTTTTAAPAAGGASTVEALRGRRRLARVRPDDAHGEGRRGHARHGQPGQLGCPARDRGRGQRGGQGRGDRAARRLLEGHRDAEARDVSRSTARFPATRRRGWKGRSPSRDRRARTCRGVASPSWRTRIPAARCAAWIPTISGITWIACTGRPGRCAAIVTRRRTSCRTPTPAVLARPRFLRGSDDLGYLLRALRNTQVSRARAATGGRRRRS